MGMEAHAQALESSSPGEGTSGVASTMSAKRAMTTVMGGGTHYARSGCTGSDAHAEVRGDFHQEVEIESIITTRRRVLVKHLSHPAGFTTNRPSPRTPDF